MQPEIYGAGGAAQRAGRAGGARGGVAPAGAAAPPPPRRPRAAAARAPAGRRARCAPAAAQACHGALADCAWPAQRPCSAAGDGGARLWPAGPCAARAPRPRAPALAARCSAPNGGGPASSTTAVADSGVHGGSSGTAGATAAAAAAAAAGAAPGAQQPQPQAASPPVGPTLQPVTFIETRALPPQPSLQQAAAALRAALGAALPRLRPLSSGVVRWEVAVPRGCSAARWLRGQDAGTHHQVYFSGRHSTAPETPKSALAEAATRGWSAVAGLGAAWLWRGAPGAAFGERQLTGLQRMLSEAQPRIRVLGGTRFDAQLAPAPEWEPFGAFCFLLPQLEYLEAANCGLLSLNIAWDGRYAPEGDASGAVGEGPRDAAAAAARAEALLASLAPPAPLSAPSPAPAAGPAAHAPSEAGWGDVARGALAALRADDAARYRPPFGLAALDPEMAKQEFISGGQQGLDDLLEALAGGRGGGGGADGGSSSGGADGGAAQAPALAAEAAGVAGAAGGPRAAVGCSSSSGGAGAGASGGGPEGDEPIIKLVLARRTAWPLTRPMEGVALLEALQERDPRAYQLFLSVPGACYMWCQG
jgi:hypothetical protein